MNELILKMMRSNKTSSICRWHDYFRSRLLGDKKVFGNLQKNAPMLRFDDKA